MNYVHVKSLKYLLKKFATLLLQRNINFCISLSKWGEFENDDLRIILIKKKLKKERRPNNDLRSIINNKRNEIINSDISYAGNSDKKIYEVKDENNKQKPQNIYNNCKFIYTTYK